MYFFLVFFFFFTCTVFILEQNFLLSVWTVLRRIAWFEFATQFYKHRLFKLSVLI